VQKYKIDILPIEIHPKILIYFQNTSKIYRGSEYYAKPLVQVKNRNTWIKASNFFV